MKTLKLFLVDKRNIKCLGVCSIELRTFLKRKVDAGDKYLLSKIDQDFPVTKMPSATVSQGMVPQIGSLHVELVCEFGGIYEPPAPSLPQSNQQAMVRPSKPKQIQMNATDENYGNLMTSNQGNNARQSGYVNPFEQFQDQFESVQSKINRTNNNGPSLKQTNDDADIDMSALISKAQNIIDEIDEGYTQDDPVRVVLDKEETENVMTAFGERETAKRQTKQLPPEIELEIIRLQKRMIKSDQPPSKTETTGGPVSNEQRSAAKLIDTVIDINLDCIEISNKSYQNKIAESICYFQVSYILPDSPMSSPPITHK